MWKLLWAEFSIEFLNDTIGGIFYLKEFKEKREKKTERNTSGTTKKSLKVCTAHTLIMYAIQYAKTMEEFQIPFMHHN